jgi:hypothetical protein
MESYGDCNDLSVDYFIFPKEDIYDSSLDYLITFETKENS